MGKLIKAFLLHMNHIVSECFIFNDKSSYVKGSAYATVLIIGMILIVTVSGAVAVAVYGRRISGYYGNYNSNYDMALSFNERAIFLFADLLTEKQEDIEAAVIERALKGVEGRLTYRNRDFLIDDSYIRRLFRDETESVINGYMENNWIKKSRTYEKKERVDISFTHDDESVQDIFIATTGVYHFPHVYQIPRSQGYVLEIKVDTASGYALVIETDYSWPTRVPIRERFIPTRFTWKDKPSYFYEGIIEGSINVDVTMLNALRQHNDKALYISDAAEWDAASTEPMVYIHTGDGCVIRSDDFAMFHGMIISYSDIVLENVHVRGLVWSAGSVTQINSLVTQDSDILFDIPFSPYVQQDFFDFLFLTQFSKIIISTNNIASVLDKIRFENTDGILQGELILNNFDDYTPRVVKSKRILQ